MWNNDVEEGRIGLLCKADVVGWAHDRGCKVLDMVIRQEEYARRKVVA
jgi:hypothetical protein